MEQPPIRLSAELSEAELATLAAHCSERGGGPLADKLGIRFTGLGSDWMSCECPVAGNEQPAGLFHGGGHVVIAESLASMHSFLLAAGRNVVGVDLNATHLRAIKEGSIYGRAEVLHHGRTLISHEVKMRDQQDRLLSIVRITNMILGRRAAS